MTVISFVSTYLKLLRFMVSRANGLLRFCRANADKDRCLRPFEGLVDS